MTFWKKKDHVLHSTAGYPARVQLCHWRTIHLQANVDYRSWQPS